MNNCLLWANLEFLELQGSIFVPPEVILDTTVPNTPDNEPGDLPPDYSHISPPPPCLTPEPSEDSERTFIEENASRTSSEVQEDVNEIIRRVQRGINLVNICLVTLPIGIRIKSTRHIIAKTHLYKASLDQVINKCSPIYTNPQHRAQLHHNNFQKVPRKRKKK